MDAKEISAIQAKAAKHNAEVLEDLRGKFAALAKQAEEIVGAATGIIVMGNDHTLRIRDLGLSVGAYVRDYTVNQIMPIYGMISTETIVTEDGGK